MGSGWVTNPLGQETATVSPSWGAKRLVVTMERLS